MSGVTMLVSVDDVRAVVEPRHQRGRQRVAAMGEDHVAALGALGLDDGGEPREAAAALAVGPARSDIR